MRSLESFFPLTRKNRRRVVVLGIAFFLSALGLAVLSNLYKAHRIEILRLKEKADLPRKALLITQVEKRPIYWVRRYSAKVEPKYWIGVAAEVPGRVSRVAADIGDAVQEGQVLVELDDTEARWRLEEAKARLETAGVEEEELKRQVANRRRLFEEGVIDQDAYEGLLNRYEGAKAGLRLAQALLEQSQYNLSRHRILSGISGSVSERLIEKGEYVQVSQALFRVVSGPPYYLRFGVSDVDLSNVSVGDTVKISAKVLKGLVEGHLTRVAPASAVRSGLFEVEVELADPTASMKPGVIAHAHFEKPLRDGLMIPTDYMMPRNGKYYVYRLDGSGGTKEGQWLEVVPHAISDAHTEIEEGLTEGDRLLFPPHAPVLPA